jgi:ElaB/YqjD/DUF883 family membrane-anchored ribosome-binding protein
MSKLGEGLRSATGNAKDGLASAKAKASQTGNAAKQKAAEALDKSRDAAARSVQSSKKLANKAVAKSTDTIDKNPLAIVVGGLALGVIIGALLPKSSREKELLGKTGQKMNARAREIAEAAKDAGTDKVNSLGLNGEAIREQFRDLVSKASEAVKAAGQAAGDAARKRD